MPKGDADDEKKVKITTAVSVAIIYLLIIPLYNQQPQEPSSHQTGTQNSPQDSTPTETISEPPNTAGSKKILTASNASRGNHTPTPAPSKK